MNTPGKASLPVIKRLPKYYRYLRTLKNDGITSISSRELAAQMGTTASQVRQDFNCIGDVNGRQGIGYSVENLLSILEHLLFGNGDLLPTILIGCGRLVALGIQGFWNFSHYDRSVSYPDVVVENVHLGDSLMSLGYRLRNQD